MYNKITLLGKMKVELTLLYENRTIKYYCLI